MTLIRSRGSLRKVAETLTLRCDAKQTEPRFLELDNRLSSAPTVRLSSYLPEAFVKGRQPTYLEEIGEEEFAYVVSTLAVQPLRINARDCRFTPKSFYDSVGGQRQLRDGDIVLTMDGGTSIGKAAVFNLEAFAEAVEADPEEVLVTVDSHVAILRPQGISPLALAYLLASPIGQAQFQRAESGASGQTAVTEDDVRYFRFPKFDPSELEDAVQTLKNALDEAQELVRSAESQRRDAWSDFEAQLTPHQIARRAA
jgi:hypothetical protein